MSLRDITGLPRPLKILILFVVDGVMASAAYWLAAIARYGRLQDLPVTQILIGMTVAAVIIPSLALAFGFYRSMTRFSAAHLPSRAGLLSATGGLLFAAMAMLGGARSLQALGFGFVFALVIFALLLASRAAARFILGGASARGAPVAIYGAGSAGRQLAAMLLRGDQLRPVAFLDDDRNLQGRVVEGIQVLDPQGTKFKVKVAERAVTEVLIAIPTLRAGRRREMLEYLSSLALRVRSVPSLADLIEDGEKNVGQLVDIAVEELLGRDPVSPLPGLLDACVSDKAVLVTGGGGSIGSELCRQVLARHPRKLVVLEQSELALYEIERELRTLAAKGSTQSELVFALGSVTDSRRIESLFREHPANTVYHAAAYKHVPIVELNPVEGFRNNVLGTRCVARAALTAGASHFVLISTDKAVRPTNVMGATKRISELVVESLAARKSQTRFSRVRFGNVLASSGSVVPLFQRQIASGGPVTVTHREVTRYFMTIPEAVELVIQAGAMAEGGELFVLDMGSPVRICDLAERMIRLSGLSVKDETNPEGDIAIEVTGLRPGEKLHEELLIDGEVTGTVHPRIMQMNEQPTDLRTLETELVALEGVGHEAADQMAIRRFLGKWVAGYVAPGLQTEPVLLRPVSSVSP